MISDYLISREAYSADVMQQADESAQMQICSVLMNTAKRLETICRRLERRYSDLMFEDELQQAIGCAADVCETVVESVDYQGLVGDSDRSRKLSSEETATIAGELKERLRGELEGFLKGLSDE